MSPATEKSSTAAGWYTIGQMRAWEKNPKKHPDSNVADIARSVRRFGFVAPVVVWGSRGQIVAGHGRYLAAQMILRADPGAYLATDAPGPALIPVRVVEFASDAEASAYALADNRLTEANPMEPLDVAAILKEIQDAGGDVEVPGWTEAEIAAMLGGQDPEPDGTGGEDAGAEEPPAEPVSRAGEVYELGPHRLVCGDCRDAGVWAALLPDGERLQMVWTDPPYGVSIVGGNHELSPKDRALAGGKSIQNDALSPEQLEQFLRDTLGMVAASCHPGSAWYVASPPGPLSVAFQCVLLKYEIYRQGLVWAKQSLVMGHSDYHYRHEPIFYGWTPGAAHYFVPERTHDSVLEFNRPTKSGDHPTMKPVELVEYCIGNSSKPNWIVGEPFGGSGTTLIACAKTGRIARVIEIDPRYCDVIRRRWTKYALSAGVDPGPGRLDA